MEIYQIVCLIFSGVPLTDEIRMALFKISKHMFCDKIRRENIKEKDYEGCIETEYKTVVLGCFAGVKFIALLETELGTARAEFIIPQNELDFHETDDTEYICMELGDVRTASHRAQNAWTN